MLVAVWLLAIAAPVSCLLVWNRLGNNGWVKVGGRVALLVLSQGVAVLLVALLVNDNYGFYGSWSELLGMGRLSTQSAQVVTHDLGRRYAPQLRAAFLSGHGTVIDWEIPGIASGVPPQHALIYLPAAYGDPVASHSLFPVVELLDGFPSTPRTWTGPLRLQSILDTEIARGGSLPFIAVMPRQNLAVPRDTECVNVVGGPRVDTYLTTDVHQAVIDNWRAAPGPASWALMGYSLGGYCALNLAMRHPDLYSAAVSLSGIARPSHDRSTGNLFGASDRLRLLNTPLWEAPRWPTDRSLSVLALTTPEDHLSYSDTLRLVATARAPLRVWAVLLAHGGHNAAVWRAMEPVAFNWLSRRLVPPLAQIRILGATVLEPRQYAKPRGVRHPLSRVAPSFPGRHQAQTAHPTASPSHES